MKAPPVQRAPWLATLAPAFFLFAPAVLILALGAHLCLQAMQPTRRAYQPDPAHPERKYYRPGGYLDRINAMIGDGKLALTGKPARARYHDNLLEPSDREFIRLSRLDHDLQVLNRQLEERDQKKADGAQDLPEILGILTTRGGKIVVQEQETYIQLPFTERPTKDPVIKISSEKGWMLASRDSAIILVDGSKDVPPTLGGLWKPGQVPTAREVYLTTPPDSSARTKRPVRSVNLQYEEKGVRVKLDDQRLEAFFNSQPATGNETFLVGDGDMLALFNRDNRAEQIIFVCRPADAVQKAAASDEAMPSPPPEGTLERLTYNFAHTKSPSDALAQTTPRQTRDPGLNERVQAALEKYIDRKNAACGLEERYSRASVTLLDPFGGDLLVLASYPTAATPVPLPTLEKFKSSQTREKFKSSQTRNANLLSHQIGSCGKPFLAACIYDTYPELGSLQLDSIQLDKRHPEDPTDKSERKYLHGTLGIPIKPSVTDKSGLSYIANKGAVFRLGREDFFRYSINTFFIDLFLLSLACDESGKVQESGVPAAGPNAANVILGGNRLTTLPNFRSRLDLAKQEVFHLEEHPPILKLKKAFDVEISGDAKQGSTEPYDLDAIAAFAALCPSRADALLRWGPRPGLLPDKVNLDFAGMAKFQPDLLDYLLGGGERCKWTNVKLAEAMARLITGNRVRATLFEPTGQPKPPLEPFSLQPETSLLMRGLLQGAIKKDGTAEELGPLLEEWNQQLAHQGYDLVMRCYSKTGTWHRKDAKGNEPPPIDSGTYVFYLSLRKKSDEQVEVRGIAGVINVEDRGSSKVAVEFAKEVFNSLRNSYFSNVGSTSVRANHR